MCTDAPSTEASGDADTVLRGSMVAWELRMDEWLVGTQEKQCNALLSGPSLPESVRPESVERLVSTASQNPGEAAR